MMIHLNPRSPKAVVLATAAILLVAGAASCAGRSVKVRTLVIPGLDKRAVKKVQKGLEASGDLAEQEEYFREAIEIAPDYARAHANLGVVYYRQARYAEAARELAEAIKLKPTEADFPYNLGLVYERLGKIEQAVECYRDALALSPNDIHAAENLARCYVKQDRHDEVLSELLKRIIYEELREDWIRWAREELVKIEGRRKYVGVDQ